MRSCSTSTPKRGGRIRVASISSSTADTLDPAKGALSTDYVRHYMLYSGLTQFDANLTRQLALAESIETADRAQWTIKLRKGVQFHDGKSLSSADVVYSLLRHKDPATASKMKTIADQIEDVKATGAERGAIRLTGANADFPAILAPSHFLIVCTHISTCSRDRPRSRQIARQRTSPLVALRTQSRLAVDGASSSALNTGTTSSAASISVSPFNHKQVWAVKAAKLRTAMMCRVMCERAMAIED